MDGEVSGTRRGSENECAAKMMRGRVVARHNPNRATLGENETQEREGGRSDGGQSERKVRESGKVPASRALAAVKRKVLDITDRPKTGRERRKARKEDTI